MADPADGIAAQIRGIEQGHGKPIAVWIELLARNAGQPGGIRSRQLWMRSGDRGRVQRPVRIASASPGQQTSTPHNQILLKGGPNRVSPASHSASPPQPGPG
jgi:hypothetical protein